MWKRGFRGTRNNARPRASGRGRAAVLIGIAIGCSACATYEPPADAPKAMIYTQPAPGTVAGGSLLNRANADYSEVTPLRGHNMVYAYGVEATIEANGRQYLEVATMWPWPGGVSYCSNYFSFVPLEGHTYVVTSEASKDYCRTHVIDRNTHAEPPTFANERGPHQGGD